MSRVAFFFFEKIDRGSGYCLMDVATAEAGAVCPVPVALDDHRAAAPGTRTREVGVHRSAVPSRGPRGATASAAQRANFQRRCLPVSLACGVSCRVRTESCPTLVGALPRKVTAAIHPTRRSGPPAPQNGPAWFPRAPDSASNSRLRLRSRPPVRSDCDFPNILIPYVRPVNRFRRSKCGNRRCLGWRLI